MLCFQNDEDPDETEHGHPQASYKIVEQHSVADSLCIGHCDAFLLEDSLSPLLRRVSKLPSLGRTMMLLTRCEIGCRKVKELTSALNCVNFLNWEEFGGI